MASSQTLRLGLVLLIAAVVAASGVVAMSVWADGPAGPAIPTWPPFTMVYETNGVVYSIGSSPSVTTREVRRLEYQSPDPVDRHGHRGPHHHQQGGINQQGRVLHTG